MLSKCANPVCQATFLYLHEGELFRWETSSGSPGNSATDLSSAVDPDMGVKKTRRIEYFWLCGNCAPSMTLIFKGEEGVIVQPKGRAQTAGL